jgi:predicted glycogen debranching enzyme
MSYLQIDNHRLNDLNYLLDREVLYTNSFGAYCSTTLIGCNTRKYHGLLVAPQTQLDQDQHVLLSTIGETVNINGSEYDLGAQYYPGVFLSGGLEFIEKIEVDPIFKTDYNFGGNILIKEILLADNSNQLLIRYRVAPDSTQLVLKIRPFLAFRNKHSLSKRNEHLNPFPTPIDGGVSFQPYPDYQPLNLQVSHPSGCFKNNADWYYNIEYPQERARGYDFHEDLFVPGFFQFNVGGGEEVVFSASLKPCSSDSLSRMFTTEVYSRTPSKSFDDCLSKAARQFVIRDDGKMRIIAGYPWFGQWGRDTFIALPGLTLCQKEADTFTFLSVIDTMVEGLQGPLFPNMGYNKQAPMNSVDAPLWFFWALQQYIRYTRDTKTIWRRYGEKMQLILEGFRQGTQFGIEMQENGLIYAGIDGEALTWMDAKSNGKAFTPRIGYPVEINALWYNAICFSLWLASINQYDSFILDWSPLISTIKKSFVKLFWNEQYGYLADCVGYSTVDWSIQPNQLFATSLHYSPLKRDQCISILKVVQNELLTPRGLRSLSTNNERYIGRYQGNQYSRDKAYHQGTVWPWLLGHFIEGYLKQFKDQEALSFVESIYRNFEPTLYEHGLGTISEVYDGDAPHQPGGAISQAWSVAELLRVRCLIQEARKLQ